MFIRKSQVRKKPSKEDQQTQINIGFRAGINEVNKALTQTEIRGENTGLEIKPVQKRVFS
jgi:hypothetical protein